MLVFSESRVPLVGLVWLWWKFGAGGEGGGRRAQDQGDHKLYELEGGGYCGMLVPEARCTAAPSLAQSDPYARHARALP
jgi:hypothetical protein